MIEPLTFLAEVAPTDTALQFGDDGARVEIWSKPIVSEYAQAVQLIVWTKKVLRLSLFMPQDNEPLLNFQASIAALASAIRFAKKDNRVKVKFDIPEIEKMNAAKLAGMPDVFRLQIEIESDKPKREPVQPTPYGQFWRELDKAGFHNRPDVRRWIEYDGMDEKEAKEAMRRKLGVAHRSTEASPEMLIQKMQEQYGGWSGAITLAENARAKTKGGEQ